MNFLKSLFKFFTGKVSDEEFAKLTEDAILCPYCNTYVDREDVISEGCCINCKKKLTIKTDDAASSGQ